MSKYLNSPVIRYILGLIELILAVGLILKFFGASAEAPLVEILYMLADALAAPLHNIFASAYFSWGGVLDMSIFSAMVIYAIFVAIPIVLHQKFQQDRPQAEELETKDLPPIK